MKISRLVNPIITDNHLARIGTTVRASRRPKEIKKQRKEKSYSHATRWANRNHERLALKSLLKIPPVTQRLHRRDASRLSFATSISVIRGSRMTVFLFDRGSEFISMGETRGSVQAISTLKQRPENRTGRLRRRESHSASAV